MGIDGDVAIHQQSFKCLQMQVEGPFNIVQLLFLHAALRNKHYQDNGLVLGKHQLVIDATNVYFMYRFIQVKGVIYHEFVLYGI